MKKQYFVRYRMFRSLLALGVVFVLTHHVRADLFMTITPSATSVTAGTVINLTLELESDSAVSVGGIDVELFSGDGSGTEGNFSSPTSLFFVPPNTGIDWNLNPGQAFYTRNVLGVPPHTPGGVSLAANNKVTFATIQLETAGVAAGSYNVVFTFLSALNQSSTGIDISGTGTSFSIITAVPEPSSMMLMLPALVAILARQRRDSDESEC